MILDWTSGPNSVVGFLNSAQIVSSSNIIEVDTRYRIRFKKRPGGPWFETEIIFLSINGDVWAVQFKEKPGGPWLRTQLRFDT